MMNRLLRISLLFTIILTFLNPVEAQSSKYRRFIRQANTHYRNGTHQEALEAYKNAFLLDEPQCLDLYNAACTASLVDSLNTSNQFISTSIRKGYINIDWLKEDADFNKLRQTSEWDEVISLIERKIAEINKDFEKVKLNPIHELVPFNDGKLWGYMLKGSSEVIVEAKFSKVHFPGDCLKVEIVKGQTILVQADGSVALFKEKRERFRIPPNSRPLAWNPPIDKTEGFNGFRVDDKGRITHVSSIYDGSEFVDNSIGGSQTPSIEILGPFKIDEKWHAVVQKNNKWGVIDEEGNELSKVGFIYNKLIPVRGFRGQESWFYFQDFDGEKGFVNSLGLEKFKGEFTEYPFSSSNKMDLIILENEEGKNGVIDVRNMEWILEPIPEQIWQIQYTFSGICTDKLSDNDLGRDKVIDFYFLVGGQDNSTYYIDSDGNRYKK